MSVVIGRSIFPVMMVCCVNRGTVRNSESLRGLCVTLRLSSVMTAWSCSVGRASD